MRTTNTEHRASRCVDRRTGRIPHLVAVAGLIVSCGPRARLVAAGSDEEARDERAMLDEVAAHDRLAAAPQSASSGCPLAAPADASDCAASRKVSLGRWSQGFSQHGGADERVDCDNGALIRRVIQRGGDRAIEVYDHGRLTRRFCRLADFSVEERAAYFAEYAEMRGELPATVRRLLVVLRQTDPTEYRIFLDLRDRATFVFFATRDDADPFGNLEAAVHESLHRLNHEASDASEWRLRTLDGGRVSVPVGGTFPISEIAADVDGAAEFVAYRGPYLTGDGGAQGLPVLLDELDAYTHSVNTTVQVADAVGSLRGTNRGLPAMMYFLEAYLARAESLHPDVWARVASQEYANAIVRLWMQAGEVVCRACKAEKAVIDPEEIVLVFREARLRPLRTLSRGLGDGAPADLAAALDCCDLRVVH
jgi:hypothetical protein